MSAAVDARKSDDRKYVICGSCRQSLCRRDRRMRPDGDAKIVDGRRVAGPRAHHFLVWGDGWHVVGDHIEMMPTALDRLLEGHKPGRKDWMNEARLDLTKALRAFAPARCPWCSTINRIDRKKLDVDGIAAY